MSLNRIRRMSMGDTDAEVFDRLLSEFVGAVELKQGEQHDDTIT